MSHPAEDPSVERGWVAREVEEEFPGLALSWIVASRRPGKSPPGVKQRLAGLSNRFYGGHAVHLREQPIPWAYRVFFRQIGLDPDKDRTPIEELALARLRHGGFRSENPVDDAITIAIVETGVALRALDADRVRGPLGIRLTAPGEGVDEGAGLARGTLVIADSERPLAILFGPARTALQVTDETRNVAIVAVGVRGVPAIAVEEAFWTASEVLAVG